MKKWELVCWNNRWYAVGMELVRDRPAIVTWGRSKDSLLAVMRNFGVWDKEPTQTRFYDILKQCQTEWDGSE